MRRKTQLVVAVTFMVTVIVAYSSYIYVSEILRQQIFSTRENAYNLTRQLAYLANDAAPDLSSTKVNTDDPKAVRRAIAYYLSTDNDLNVLVESVVGDWPLVYDVAVVDADGKAILHSNLELINKSVADRPDFQRFQDARFQDQLRMLYRPPSVYEVRMPLLLNGAAFGSVRVGVSTVLLRSDTTPRLRHALILSGMTILLSLILAAGLSNLALGPLERISRSLDSVTAGNTGPIPGKSLVRTNMARSPQKSPTSGSRCVTPKKSFPP